MKHFIKIAVCLAGGLALSASARADDIALTGNPYAQVVARNIFGLNPPVVVDPNAASLAPPVKIMPNGIMSIFGQVQVLFKAAGTAPGRENSYMLAEGQRQDDIEVTKIDEKNGIVTFNNHGEIQTLPLVSTTSPALASMSNGGGTGISGVPSGGNFGSSGFNNAFGGRGNYNGGFNGAINSSSGNGGGGNGGGGNGGNNASADDGSNIRSIPTRNSAADASSQIPPGMTPEVQTIAIEANRIATQQQVDSGELPPLPATEITPPEATGIGGAPLVTPAPGSQ
jgi:hypothetical protein